jgi:hypothetical protein
MHGDSLCEELFGHDIQLIGPQCCALVQFACWLMLQNVSSPLLVMALNIGTSLQTYVTLY